MSENIVCGVSDIQVVKQGACKWPHKKITYFEEMSFNGYSRDKVRSMFDEALRIWSTVADIQPVRVESVSGANIAARTAVLAGGTLGWSGIPCGSSSTSQMSQRYKSNTTWRESTLLCTMLHEIGHALGLPHLGGGTVMAATISGILIPTAKDVKEIQLRYGPPTAVPTPGPIIPPNPGLPTSLTLDGPFVYWFAAPDANIFEFSFSVPPSGFLGWGSTNIGVAVRALPAKLTIYDGSKVVVEGNDKVITKLSGGTYRVKVEFIYSGMFEIAVKKV